MFLYKSYSGLDLHTGATPIFKIAPGVLRGIADMGTGILGYEISKGKKIKCVKLIRIVTLWVLFTIMVCFPHSTLDFVFVPFSVLLIVTEFFFLFFLLYFLQK